MSTLSISPAFTAPRSVRAPQSTVRLTRRGRVVLFLAAMALLLLSAFFLGSVAVGSETPGQAEPTEIVMVGTGDTLWGIASDLNTDGDVRSTMTRDRAAQRPRLRRTLRGPEAPRAGQRRLTTTASASRLDPGWRAGEDEGRATPVARPSRHLLVFAPTVWLWCQPVTPDPHVGRGVPRGSVSSLGHQLGRGLANGRARPARRRWSRCR